MPLRAGGEATLLVVKAGTRSAAAMRVFRKGINLLRSPQTTLARSRTRTQCRAREVIWYVALAFRELYRPF